MFKNYLQQKCLCSTICKGHYIRVTSVENPAFLSLIKREPASLLSCRWRLQSPLTEKLAGRAGTHAEQDTHTQRGFRVSLFTPQVF